jgi:two-component system cell cycle sensor histidine kinase PleC
LRTEIDGAGWLNADRSAIEKILTILLNNALKYTPQRGQITVRVRALEETTNIYVEDTGVGIPAEALARLGRPFEQLDGTMSNGMRGSGLGLAIARSLIDLHGGTLRIRSSAGQGTIIQVHLPNSLGAERAPLSFASASAAVKPRIPAQRPASLPAKKSAGKISATA